MLEIDTVRIPEFVFGMYETINDSNNVTQRMLDENLKVWELLASWE